MPPVSKRTLGQRDGEPPSEQSCAERSRPADGRVRQQRDAARARASRSSAGGIARDEAVDDLQVLAAAELAAPRRAGRSRRRLLGTTAPSARVASSISPTTPMTGVG